jgi:uncharacterized membrane-anchored protein YhcB (DUF1043 family)
MRWFWAVLVFGVAVGVLVGYQIARWQKTPTEVDLNLPQLPHRLKVRQACQRHLSRRRNWLRNP